MQRPTIFALSSGAPPAAVAVIRISGPAAGEALSALHGKLPEPRRATLGWLRDPVSGERLDRALLLWFPGPRTATGEDLAELHLHGGRAVTVAVQNGLKSVPNLRLAEPGEFTRRAFENGVMDLAEAEGLADLLAAETEAQRRNAQELAGGALSRRIAVWQGRILGLSAAVEATLDFADEGDVDDAVADSIAIEARTIADEMSMMLRAVPAERLRDGVRVVLAGPPNVGKSTLLNALVGREAAITAATPGTTRDSIEVPIGFAGIPFLLTDTAGLRENAAEAVERIGMERAHALIDSADILLWLGEAGDAPLHPARLLIHAQCDVADRIVDRPADAIAVSGLTGEGLDTLVQALVAAGERMIPGRGEVALNQRQRLTVEDCAGALAEAVAQPESILVAESLRRALVALDRLTGRAGAEEMLDALFGRFCIGK